MALTAYSGLQPPEPWRDGTSPTLAPVKCKATDDRMSEGTGTSFQRWKNVRGRGQQASIDFFVGSDCLEKNCFGAFILDESKNNPQIISRAGSPRTLEISPQFVSAQHRVKCIFCQESQGSMQVIGNLRVFAHRTSRRPHKRCRAKQEPSHGTISLISSSGVRGWHCPPSNSCRA